MARELVIETIENLAASQGFYGRLLRYLEELSDRDPEAYEKAMSGLEMASDPVDLILMLEA